MNCPNCGSELDPGVKFCNKCGAQVNQPSSPPPAPAASPPPYAAPQYGAPASSPRPGQGLSTASMVLGIISVVFSLMTCVPFINYCTCLAVPILALVGLILGIVGVSQAGPEDKGKATWGIILSAASILIGVVVIILYILGVVSLSLLQEANF